MNVIEKDYPTKPLVKRILHQARTGLWEGDSLSEYFFNCAWLIKRDMMGLILTRDINHHQSGWWKNPDYDQCWHLSMSFRNPDGSRRSKDIKKTEKWLDLIYGRYKKMIWTEPPWSEPGIKNDSWHYRLFCDKNWQGIIPRGEVYSKTYTEPGWMSYSELQSYHKNEIK